MVRLTIDNILAEYQAKILFTFHYGQINYEFI